MQKKILLSGSVVLIFSQSVFAAPGVLNFAPESFTVDTSLSVLNGESGRFVYNAQDGSKVSELNWKIKNTPILKAGITWDAHPRVTLNANGWTTLASRGSDMDDYDWLTPGQSHWSHWSNSPATRLNFANQYDVNLTGWLLKEADYQFGAMVGYQETRFSWLATGGHYEYANGAHIGDFPRNERVIGYKQKFKLPYLGLSGRYRYRDFDVIAQFKFSPWVDARDNDEHYMRNLTFREKTNNSNYYSGTLNVGYYITPQARIFTEFTWTRFSEGKSGIFIRDNLSGKTEQVGGDAAGLQNYNYTVGAGIQYRF